MRYYQQTCFFWVVLEIFYFWLSLFLRLPRPRAKKSYLLIGNKGGGGTNIAPSRSSPHRISLACLRVERHNNTNKKNNTEPTLFYL